MPAPAALSPPDPGSSASGRALARLADAVAPLAILAVGLARLFPDRALSAHGDWLLAALVLLTAIGIDPAELARLLRRRAALIVGVAVGVLLCDTALAFLVARPFHGATRSGVLSLGLASTEVASVGLVGLAGGDAAFALSVLVTSLVASAVLGPLLAGVLGHAAGGGSPAIVGRFALVVLVPLAAGLAARRARPRLRRFADHANGLSALVVCGLLYAAVSGVRSGPALGAALAGSALFLIGTGALGGLLARVASSGRLARLARPVSALPAAPSLRAAPAAADPTALVFTTALRDFAVAATIAQQAFGSAASSVAGVYGALMLLTGAVAATVLRRRDLAARR